MADSTTTTAADEKRSDERRKGDPEAPVFGELLLEAQWQPETILSPELEGWHRAKGLVPERRLRERRGR